MKLAYPAFFYEEEEGFSVVFPDLPGCVTQGDTIEEAMEMAADAAAGWLLITLEEGEDLPKASKVEKIKFENENRKGFMSYVLIDLGAFSEKYSEKKYVKKTLTLPYWLNEIAERKGLNFSKTLQEALIRKANQ